MEDDGLEALDGVWQALQAELGGRTWSDELVGALTLTMRRRRYTVVLGGTLDRGTVKLNPDATPGAIDVHGTEGPNDGKTFLAIYRLQGDTLQICYDLVGEERPTEFATAESKKRFLVTYERKGN